MENNLSFDVRLAQPYEQAIESVTAALKAEGFGVLTRIDMSATFKEKINQAFRPYAILGACNPPLAFRALSEDGRAGLLLPCNVTVESDGSGVLVRITDPLSLFEATLPGSETLGAVANEARARLQRVAESLERQQAPAV